MEYVYAEVYVLGIPCRADRRYTYFLPPSMRGEVRPGLFIRVPFGGGNRQRIALVAALAEAYTGNIDPKPVLAVCDDCVSLDAELLGLCLFMKEQTMCTVGGRGTRHDPAGGAGQVCAALSYCAGRRAAR